MTVTSDPATAPDIPAPARFEPHPGSIAAARRHVRRLLTEWAADEVLEDALVLVSELATNAVVHAGTPFEVGCVHRGGSIRLEVRDGYPARGLPAALPVPDLGRSSGRGLMLCASLASAWGVEYTPTSKTVWCRVDLPGSDVRFAEPAEPAPDRVLVAVVGQDADGQVSDWNADAELLLAWPAGDVAGRAFAELVVGGEAPGGRWAGGLELRRRDGRLEPLYAVRAPRAGGGGVWLLVRAAHRAVLSGSSAAAGASRDDASWAAFTDADLVQLRFDDMLERAADRACDAFDADAAYLLLGAAYGFEARLVTSGLPQRRPVPVPDLALADQLAVGSLPAVHDELGDAAAMPVLAGTGMRSAAVAQLLAEGRPIGQLCVAAVRPDAFGMDAALRLQRGADRLALSVEARRVAESTRRHRDWLGYLAEASDLLAGTLDPQMTIAMLAQLVVPRLATWCAIRLYDERGVPGLSYAWHSDETRIDALRRLLDAAPAELAALERTPRVVAALLDVGGADAVRDDVAVVLPLRARGRGLGVAVLGRPGEPFEQETLGLADELVRRAALALDNALLYRTHRATSEALQRSLLPAALPEVPGLDVGVAYQAAGEGLDVGGDFYDLFAVGPDRWRFTIGDVAGSGPEAAGVTGLARHALQLLGQQSCPPAEAVGQLNQAILEQRAGGRFLTLLHGEITPRAAGGMRVELVVAGHPLPFLLHPHGRADQVGSPQPLLGVVERVTYRTNTVHLLPGESLICVTDGVLERRDGRRILGEDDLAGLLGACAGLSAGATATAIQRAVVDYAPQPPRDDMAVLVLRVTA